MRREILYSEIPCPKEKGSTLGVRMVTSSPPREFEIECKAGGTIKLKQLGEPYKYDARCLKCGMSTTITFKPETQEECPNIDLMCLFSEEKINVNPDSLTTNSECPRYHAVCPHSQGKGFLIVGPITKQDKGKGTKIECTHCGACCYKTGR